MYVISVSYVGNFKFFYNYIKNVNKRYLVLVLIGIKGKV